MNSLFTLLCNEITKIIICLASLSFGYIVLYFVVSQGKVDDIICSEGFFLDIPPIAGAVEAVKELASMEE